VPTDSRGTTPGGGESIHPARYGDERPGGGRVVAGAARGSARADLIERPGCETGDDAGT